MNILKKMSDLFGKTFVKIMHAIPKKIKKDKKIVEIKRLQLRNPAGNDKVRKEKVSMKFMLTLSHILIAVLPITFIAFALTNQASEALMKEVSDSNMAYTSKVTRILDGYITNIENTAKIITTDLNLIKAVSRDASFYATAFEMEQDRDTNIINKIKSLMMSNEMIRNIFIVKDTEIIGNSPFVAETFIENFYSGPEYQILREANSSPVWFFNLYNKDDIYLMQNMNNVMTNAYIGTLVIQLKNEMFLEDIKMDFGENVKSAIIDETGKVVLEPSGQDPLGEIGYLDRINEFIGNNEVAGSFTARTGENSDIDTSVFFAQCRNGWIFLIEVPQQELLSSIQMIEKLSLIMTLGVCVIAVVVGILLSVTISRPIDYIRGKLKLVEDGDLTVRSNYTGKYEIGQLSQSFNNMTINMNALLRQVGSVADKVYHNANELKEIAKKSAQASKEVMQAVESVTIGAAEQAKDAEKASVIIRDFVSQLNTTEKHFSYVINATSKTREASSNAKTTIDVLNLTTRDMMNLSKEIQRDIKKLVGKIQEISGIIGLIDGISKQTNLLALNASIEAARAGQSGKGFAVIAEEIRKLAIQSGDAVKNISEIIRSINDEASHTEAIIVNGAGIFEKQEEAVRNTDNIFKEIIENMDSIIKEVNVVTQVTEQLSSIQTQATDSISSIASIAQDSAAAMEEVLANGQEQLAASEHLVSMAIELSDVINVMNEHMSRFRIEK